MSTTLPKALSQTHLHILAIINTEIDRTRKSGGVISILDAGCGNGNLMSYLSQAVIALNPSISCNVCGFDVSDHGVQKSGFLDTTRQRLAREFPGIDWANNIRTITAEEPWPFESDKFDFVVSNQVLEHVANPVLFFQEAKRVLVWRGKMINLFPLRHYWFEGHLHLPFVHWIRSYDLMHWYIAALSRIGLGKFKGHHQLFGVSVDRFAEQHADYMYFYTNYLSESEAYEIAKKIGMRASFRFSTEFYAGKLRSMMKLPARYSYRVKGRSLSDALAVKFLRYLSSVTFICEKNETYTER